MLTHALMAVLGLGLWKGVLAIVVVDWTRFARVVRGEVLALREREFVEAARAVGLPAVRVLASRISARPSSFFSNTTMRASRAYGDVYVT